MKKFKEFMVVAGANAALFKAIKKHAKAIGYDVSQPDADAVYWLYFHDDCSTSWNRKGAVTHSYYKNREVMTIREFFRLTPDDVIVEPERFDVSLSIGIIPPPWAESNKIKSNLTRCQIDEITAIMERES